MIRCARFTVGWRVGAAGGRGRGGRTLPGIVLGSGDDAAVVRPTPLLNDLVVTTDAFVEGRHYTDQFETRPRRRAPRGREPERLRPRWPPARAGR